MENNDDKPRVMSKQHELDILELIHLRRMVKHLQASLEKKNKIISHLTDELETYENLSLF
jgi:hypothetical protein